jgi:hypothetical protein
VDTNKKIKLNRQRRICIPKVNQIYYNSWLHIYFLKYSFANYVCASFQFSKNGKYAQKICIGNFQLYWLLKKLTTLA